DLFTPLMAPAFFVQLTTLALAARAGRQAEVDRRRLTRLLEAAQKAPARPVDADAETVVPARVVSRPSYYRGPLAEKLLFAEGELEEPVEIGRYLVQRTLGRGGMGAIFLALDRDLGRPVALKVLQSADK